MAEYDKRRMADPVLSALGEKQAALLPKHPHLEDLRLAELSKEHRVRVVTSPMRRAIETSIPLIKAYNLPKALLVASVCEKGGSYTSHKRPDAPEISKYENKRDPGATRAELQAKWGETHDASEVYEDGWWRCPECPGAEQNDAFHKRLLEAKAWIEKQVLDYGANGGEDRPDYMIIVSD